MIEPGTLVRHDLVIRRLTVSAVQHLSPSFARITLREASAGELNGFVSPGPADHCKVFFPDPTTGTIAAPSIVAGKMQRPEGVIARDFTPRYFRTGPDHAELDLDFFLHGDNGPASSWAAQAAVGDPLVIGGPRGSRTPPTGMSRVVLLGDETALPALARWIETLADDVEICTLVTLTNPDDAGYLEPQHVNRARVVWLDKQPGRLAHALADCGTIDDDTFVWAAGEATALVPIRRYLRRELGLPASQATVDGYWKAGEPGRDHHAPIDPEDPEL